jgi:transposase InsO family protein
VDLCFVPEQHPAQEKLPAVSGSSGHLTIKPLAGEGEAGHWPGQVFAQPGLDYEAAMLQYVAATRDRLSHAKTDRVVELKPPSLYRQAVQARAERYRQREQRKREEAAWKAAKSKHHQAWLDWRSLSRQERQQQQAWWESQEQAWRELQAQRQQILRERQQENETWHQRNRELQGGSASRGEARSWIAILVVTDNCTRQCLGLPLFRSGAQVSSRELVAALKAVLPEELAFLISDQGAHFRSKAFGDLVQEADFIHVPVYRHRPQTNGIAERFVLTLKDWLRDKGWQSAEELEAYLAAFTRQYNDRPHQGLAIPGLSPNEFAKRIWLV